MFIQEDIQLFLKMGFGGVEKLGQTVTAAVSMFVGDGASRGHDAVKPSSSSVDT